MAECMCSRKAGASVCMYVYMSGIYYVDTPIEVQATYMLCPSYGFIQDSANYNIVLYRDYTSL